MEGKMDSRKILADSLLLGILFFGQVMCYPNGAPDSACSSMTPIHGVNASNVPAPYTITTSKNAYRPNEEITVTLQANSGVNFKGFLMQPRKNSSISQQITSQQITVGSLTGDFTKNLCTGLASLTHTNSSLKTTVNVIWKAPAVAVDTVVFVATFVQTKATFWINVKSRELIPDSSVPATSSSGGGGGGITTASSDNDGKVTAGSSGAGGEVTRAYIGGVSTVTYGASLTYSLIWILLVV